MRCLAEGTRAADDAAHAALLQRATCTSAANAVCAVVVAVGSRRGAANPSVACRVAFVSVGVGGAIAVVAAAPR